MDPENLKPMGQLFSAPLTAHLIHLIHWEIYLHQARQNEAAAAVVAVAVVAVVVEVKKIWKLVVWMSHGDFRVNILKIFYNYISRFPNLS